MKRFLGLLALLSLCGCVAPHQVKAQFIGYTAPQTVQQSLATNQTCPVGSTVTFPISNLGQTQHYLTISSITGAQIFKAEIEGKDTQGNVYLISDVAELPGLSLQRQGALAASGYFPQIQVKITCAPDTATFTANYSGAWGTFNTQVGAYLFAAIDKVPFFEAPGAADEVDTVQTPYGTSAGTLLFQQQGVTVSAGTIVVSCQSNLGILQVGSTLTPTTGTGVQTFTIASTPCPLLTVSYLHGASTATNVTVEYLYKVPGT